MVAGLPPPQYGQHSLMLEGVAVPERVGLSPLVLPLLGLVVTETPLGCGLRLRHGGHLSVHIVHPGPDPLNI